MTQDHIRNFCIIAHIDHGKSTLADRLLEMTGTVEHRDMQEQLLDSNPIERERGITIKLAPVRMIYKMPNDKLQMSNKDESFSIGNLALDISNSEYILNLIDTPGHVDFNYEVSRSLQACEGAVLVVDATQGVQAQTLANLNLARGQNLTIIPVINKIDLPNAQIERCLEELSSLGFSKTDVISISAKTGTNVEEVLVAIVKKIPPPKGVSDGTLRALVFSSHYDTHKGVVIYVRIVDGTIQNQKSQPKADPPRAEKIKNQNFNSPQPSLTKRGSLIEDFPLSLRGGQGELTSLRSNKLLFMASGISVEPIEIGTFAPGMIPTGELLTGEVGYIATGLKDVGQARVGDTVTIMPNAKLQMTNNKDTFSIGHLALDIGIKPLPGYKEPKPMVFLDLYPIQSDEITVVREAMGKLRLSDNAFSYRPIHSLALGNGFHCGFLGLLHAEVVQERLSREFGLSILATPPTVEYLVKLKGKENVILNNSEGSLANARFSNNGFDKLTTGLRDSSSAGGRTQNDKVGGFISIQSPVDYPDPSIIEETREPMMEVKIYTPQRYIGGVMQLCQEKRGEFIDMKYMTISTVISAPCLPAGRKAGIRIPGQAGDDQVQPDMVLVTYLMPLSEMIIDFFDRLKSITEGYASLDYEFFDYQQVELVKLDILLNHEKVDAFSQLVVSSRAQYLGRLVVEKLAEVIPRHQFQIPIQATIGGSVIARADVKAFRKDVTQKLYGGDRTRKDKLLEAQKRGKKKMKTVGRVEIPQNAFLEVFKNG